MSWNYRGFGNPMTVRELRKIVKQEGPALLFVVETKIRGGRVESLQDQLGFACSFAVDSNGINRGIALFWSDEIHVELKNYSQAHIDVTIRRKHYDQPPWQFISFYGEPRAENGHHTWEFLHILFAKRHDGWLCMGYFNEILFAEEHFSMHTRPAWQMHAFRDTIDLCSLQDLGWRGVPFT